MSLPTYNIYVRFFDASSDCRWSQIWVDSYPDFETALKAFNSFDTDVIGEDRILVLSVNKEGAIYGNNEITMALGKVIEGKLCSVSDDYCIGNQDWYPKLSKDKSSFDWWKTEDNANVFSDIAVYGGALKMRRCDHTLLMCKINKDILSLVCERFMPSDDYVRYKLSVLDNEIKRIESGLPELATKVKQPPQPYDNCSYLKNKMYGALYNAEYGTVLVVEAALRICLERRQLFVDIPDINMWLIQTIKSHTTLCMVLERNLF